MTEDSGMVSLGDYTATRRTRVARKVLAVASISVLAAAMGALLMEKPPGAILGVLPVAFLFSMLAYSYTAPQENLVRKANVNFFILAVMVLTLVPAYILPTWKGHGWTPGLKLCHVAGNAFVQLMIFLAFRGRGYRKIER